jgi:hypothetical protein
MVEYMRVRMEVGKDAKLYFTIEPHEEVLIRKGLFTDALKELTKLKDDGWEIVDKSENTKSGFTEYLWSLKKVKNSS